MTETLDKIKNHLSKNLDGIRVQAAYESNYLDRPVITPSVYVALDDSPVNGAMNFIVYVYTSVTEGGSGCIRVAEKTAKLIESCESLLIGELTVGRVKYNNNSNAFVIEVQGTAIADNNSLPNEPSVSGTVAVTAYDFEDKNWLRLPFTASDYSVKSDYQPYPINTICSSMPIAVIKTGTVYKITLESVNSYTAKLLSANGCFSLKLQRGSDTAVYDMCFPNTDVTESVNMGKTVKVEILSYA